MSRNEKKRAKFYIFNVTHFALNASLHLQLRKPPRELRAYETIFPFKPSRIITILNSRRVHSAPMLLHSFRSRREKCFYANFSELLKCDKI